MEITGQESFLEAVMLEPREVWGPPGGDPVSSLRLRLERLLCRLLMLFFLGAGVCARVWGLFFGLGWSAGCLSRVRCFLISPGLHVAGAQTVLGGSGPPDAPPSS